MVANNSKKLSSRKRKIRLAKIRIIVFAIIALGLIFVAINAKRLCPFDPYEQDLSIAYMAPDNVHIMGTDAFGRDMFSRVIMGAQVSVLSTLVLVTIITITGMIVGIISGYYGGFIDSIIMRISDFCMAFPGLVFALAVAAILGGGIVNAIIALALISWPKYARIARSQTLSTKALEYIQGERAAGINDGKIIFKHILPNIFGPILVTAMLDIGTMMMELAGLSFLGLGAQPPIAEWGSMMSNGRSMLQTYPWVVLSPGMGIFISVVIFNLLGDGVRDLIDPRNKNY